MPHFGASKPFVTILLRHTKTCCVEAETADPRSGARLVHETAGLENVDVGFYCMCHGVNLLMLGALGKFRLSRYLIQASSGLAL
jgi:hypothetical protein